MDWKWFRALKYDSFVLIMVNFYWGHSVLFQHSLGPAWCWYARQARQPENCILILIDTFLWPSAVRMSNSFLQSCTTECQSFVSHSMNNKGKLEPSRCWSSFDSHYKWWHAGIQLRPDSCDGFWLDIPGGWQSCKLIPLRLVHSPVWGVSLLMVSTFYHILMVEPCTATGHQTSSSDRGNVRFSLSGREKNPERRNHKLFLSDYQHHNGGCSSVIIVPA